MERSSKFLSLSGLAGIFAGITALAGTAITWFFILDSGRASYVESGGTGGALSWTGVKYSLVVMALVVLTAAVTGAIVLSWRNARKADQLFWTVATRRLLVHFLVPLCTGGILILILLFQHKPELTASLMLIFYGLGLVNAGKFTFGEIHYLGLTMVVLGLLAVIWMNFGLLFWAAGFGVMHILYGSVMYFRHERPVRN
jgi:hypothetical protein